MSDQNPKSLSDARLNSFRIAFRELAKQCADEPDRVFFIHAINALAGLQEQQTEYLAECLEVTTKSIQDLRGDATEIHRLLEERQP